MNGYRRFNNDLKKGLSDKIRVCDLYTYINNLVFQKEKVYENHAHYVDSAYKKIYEYLKSGEVTMGQNEDDDSIISDDVIEDFYFETFTEGLLSFSSQFDWKQSPGKNFTNLASAIIVSICKYLILFILFFRMLILGLIIAISPILVIINIFKRINRTTGFIVKWVRLFIYLVFLRLFIYLIYCILLKAFPAVTAASLATNPYYIIGTCLVLDIVSLYTVNKILKSMFKREVKIKA